MQEKWFNFGYYLCLTLSQLDDIETKYHDPLQCIKEVLFQWRVNNPKNSLDPLTEALHKIGLTDMVICLREHFTVLRLLELEFLESLSDVPCIRNDTMTEMAAHMSHCFTAPCQLEPLEEVNDGVYCSLCDKYHERALTSSWNEMPSKLICIICLFVHFPIHPSNYSTIYFIYQLL